MRFRSVAAGAVLVLFVFSSACPADETAMAAAFKRFMEGPDSPIILRGDYLKAVLVAYRDFSKTLGQGDKGVPDLSKLENYDISIDQTPTTIVVQFGPTVRGKTQVVFGGGAQYVLDRSTFSVKQKTLLK